MIFITGDCHGDFRKFSAQSFAAGRKLDKSDYVIVCGDFGGIWDRSAEEEYWLKWLADKNFTLLWVDGNHENYDLLKEYPVARWKGGAVQYIRPNLIHLMRGQLYTIEGMTFFAFGGARSHDIIDGILEPDDPMLRLKRKALEGAGACYRINHVSWWEEEMPSGAEMELGRERLAEAEWKCDFIITHCAPSSIQNCLSSGRYAQDPLTEYLEEIKRKCAYKRWYFGHYHSDGPIDVKHTLLYNKIEKIC